MALSSNHIHINLNIRLLIKRRIAHWNLLHFGLQAKEFAPNAHYSSSDDVEQPPGGVGGERTIVPPADQQMQYVEGATGVQSYLYIFYLCILCLLKV